MNFFSSNFTLGILGGGQLGKMLLYDTQKFDIKTIVLDPSDQAPCTIGCTKFYQGDLMDFDTVYEFGKKADVLTFEIEHVNVGALEKLESEGVKVFPAPSTLKLIQNKGAQKDFYRKQQIPTADYHKFESLEALRMAVDQQRIELPFIWKSAMLGYDGNGVKIIRRANDLSGLPEYECIAEEMIAFKNELAVIVARNPSVK